MMGVFFRNVLGRISKVLSLKHLITLFLMVCVYHLGRYSATSDTEAVSPDLMGVKGLAAFHLNRDIRMEKGEHHESEIQPPHESKAILVKSESESLNRSREINNPVPIAKIEEPIAQPPKVESKPADNKVYSVKPAPTPTPTPPAVKKTPSPKPQEIKPQTIKPQTIKPKSPPSGTNLYLAKDYYGTGSRAYHEGLKMMGAESVSKHSFKSPYIVDPHVYSRSTIRKPPGSRKMKTISCYNCPERFYTSYTYNNDFQQCPYSECRLTTTPGPSNADIMLFWQDPETPPPPKPKHQGWIYMTWESPPHRSYPKPKDAWLDKFNWTMTYRLNADIVFPYDQMFWRDHALLKPDSYYLAMAKRKTKMATWWVSHCETRAHREQYVRELQKYIDVDVYGECGNMSCDYTLSSSCHDDLDKTYKFYLSFENSFCHEYVTEKFFKMFRNRYNIIPVVRSSFDYGKHLPSNILVDAEKFKSPKDLADYLKALANNHTLYAKMLKEKDRLGILNRKIDWCDFCEKIHTGKLKPKVIHDIKEYTDEGGRCWDKVIKEKS